MSFQSFVPIGMCIAVLAALPAAAQQRSEQTGSVASTQSREESPRFSGIYLGVGGGFADFENAESTGQASFLIGIRRQEKNGLVYGVEGLAGAAGDADGEPFLDLFDGFASIMGKVGYTPDNRVLFYGGIGYGSVQTETDEGEDNSFGGAAFEGGVEYMFLPFMGARASAQYYAVGDDRDATVGAVSVFFNF